MSFGWKESIKIFLSLTSFDWQYSVLLYLTELSTPWQNLYALSRRYWGGENSQKIDVRS